MINKYYQNLGAKEYIQRYGIKNALRRGLFMSIPVHCVKNYEIKKVLWQKKAAVKIGKYLKYKDVEVKGLIFSQNNISDPVWVYWDKGIEYAPAIVKRCFESIRNFSNRDVIFLSDENLAQYIQLPEYIEKKRANGHIPTAGYSDLIRFALLQHYGGTWIDSTVYLTDYIPEEILNSDFFAFHNSLLLIDNPALYPAWFLHAKHGNKTITEIRNVAFAYWKNNRHVLEYLLPNLIITQVLSHDLEAENKMLYLNSDYSEYLVKFLPEEYSEKKWAWIKELTSIHKLTYKLDPSIDKEGNFYSYLLSK